VDFRLFYKRRGQPISPWHHLALQLPGSPFYTMVTEIPRGSNQKMEVTDDERFNPIKQDLKNGAVRVLTHGPVLRNYGMMPQTWEDPAHVRPDVSYPGDGDPLDIIDMGDSVLSIGSVTQVKVLGVLGLIDEGECDWKILAVQARDPLARELNDIDDVLRKRPGTVEEVREWYRVYKKADGKAENSYLYDGVVKNKAFAEEVIRECHESWKKRYGDASTDAPPPSPS